MGIQLTPEQEAQRLKRQEEIPNQIAAAEQAEATVNSVVAELEKTNDLNEAYWHYYNEDVIGHYEQEIKLMNGDYIENPILLSEIHQNASYQGRLNGGPTVYDPIRQPEFDFGGLSFTKASPTEKERQGADNFILSFLLAGIDDGPNPTSTTTTPLDSYSTSFEVEDPANIVAGRRYLVRDASNAAVIECSSVDGVSAPYVVNFEYYDLDGTIFTPMAPLSTGASLLGTRVFSDTERLNKVTTPVQDQSILDRAMDAFVNSLNKRIDLLNLQEAEIDNNKDDDIDPLGKQGIQDTREYINSFLSALNFSNEWLFNMQEMVDGRGEFMDKRATYLIDYLSQDGGFYDKRYNIAVVIGHKMDGSYSVLMRTGQSSSFLAAQKAMLENVSNVYS